MLLTNRYKKALISVLLMAAQKAKSTKARKTAHGSSDVIKSGKAPALSSRMHAKTKAA
jgi:hypothetical protein